MDTFVQIKRLVIARHVLFTQKAESEMDNETPTSEPLPCPECGAEQMVHRIENCQFDDGLVVKRLRHFRCAACNSRFFDDAAMHRIQEERAARAPAHAA